MPTTTVLGLFKRFKIGSIVLGKQGTDNDFVAKKTFCGDTAQLSTQEKETFFLPHSGLLSLPPRLPSTSEDIKKEATPPLFLLLLPLKSPSPSFRAILPKRGKNLPPAPPKREFANFLCLLFCGKISVCSTFSEVVFGEPHCPPPPPPPYVFSFLLWGGMWETTVCAGRLLPPPKLFLLLFQTRSLSSFPCSLLVFPSPVSQVAKKEETSIFPAPPPPPSPQMVERSEERLVSFSSSSILQFMVGLAPTGKKKKRGKEGGGRVEFRLPVVVFVASCVFPLANKPDLNKKKSATELFLPCLRFDFGTIFPLWKEEWGISEEKTLNLFSSFSRI